MVGGGENISKESPKSRQCVLYHMYVDLENKLGPASLDRSPLQILDMTVGKLLTEVGEVEWERTSKSESLEIKGKGEERDRDDQWSCILGEWEWGVSNTISVNSARSCHEEVDELRWEFKVMVEHAGNPEPHSH